MLNKEDRANIQLIEETAKLVWRDNMEFGELTEIKSPYPEFEWPIRLYDVFDVRLEYDRSTVGCMIRTSRGYIGLSRLAGEPVFIGLKSCIPENLLHNFRVLDNLIRSGKLD